jgi:mannose-1-phosphate guanylyltransferase
MINSRWVQVAVTKAKQESLRDERNYVFNMIRSPSPKELVPAQFRALRTIRGDEFVRERDANEVGGGVGANYTECHMAAHVTQSPRQMGKESVGADAHERGPREAVSLERRWGVVLAGGDGARLRGLTRFAFGDDRPKQFCPLLGKDTLLQEARQRAERSISPDHILYSLTRTHQNYYLRDLADRPCQRVVQPCNKGTAPAILYTLSQIARMDPDAVVAILPSDHYYSREDVFTAALESAFAIAEEGPGSIVLLGAQPTGPEVEYGWIELGDVVGPCEGVLRVTKFHEKPRLPIAKHLLRSGSLWNTFVMVGHINAFLDLALASVPALLQALRSAPTFSTSDGETGIAEIYDRIDHTDFSRQVLSPGATRLLTLRLGDVEWSDLGDPDRVMYALLESGVELPDWARRWRTAGQAKRACAQQISAAVA